MEYLRSRSRTFLEPDADSLYHSVVDAFMTAEISLYPVFGFGRVVLRSVFDLPPSPPFRLSDYVHSYVRRRCCRIH